MATAEAIISVADLKRQLAIDSDDSAVNDAVIRQRGAALRFIADITGRRLLDGQEIFNVGYPARDGLPVSLPLRAEDASAVDAAWAMDADGSAVAIEGLELIEGGDAAGMAALRTPAEGFDSAADGYLRVRLSVGIAADAFPETLVEAAILLTREYYDGSGQDTLDENSLIWVMVRPHICLLNP